MNLSSTDATSQIPPPPRGLTPAVRRRAWADPRARFWWICSAVLCAIILAFAVFGFRAWREETGLIHDGIAVDASIYAINNISRPGLSADPSNPVLLQFSWHDQKYITQRQQPPEGYGRFVTNGDSIKVHVDPNNPDHWTALSEPMPLRDRLMGATLTLPAAIATFLAAGFRQRRVTGLWQSAQLTPSLVLSSSISALAPLGTAVRCTPAQEGDARVFTVYLARRGASLERGEPIDLLARPAPAQLAVAAEFFA